MAYDGQIVECTVVEVQPNYTENGRAYSGSVTVKITGDDTVTGTVIMVNGSQQNVPIEDRVVGKKGLLRWGRFAGYHGWLWTKVVC